MIRPVYNKNDEKEDVNKKSFMLGDKKEWRITVPMITSGSVSKMTVYLFYPYKCHETQNDRLTEQN